MLRVIKIATMVSLLMVCQAMAQESNTATGAASPTNTSVEKASQPKAVMQEAPVLKVVEAAIATGVENRTPVGAASTFTATIGKLYCFTKVVGAKQPTEIKHVWFFNNTEVTSITLPVKAVTWRTFSNKTIPPYMKGDWKVEVQSSDGKVLKAVDFKVE
jgi:Protein of unknown function (DUF2914)